jgi:biopolymer transport protein ExbD
MELKIGGTWGMVCTMFALSCPSTYTHRTFHILRRRQARAALFMLLPLMAASASACKREAETAAASATEAPARQLSDLEIPVALRTRDSEPTDAHKVEATTEQLRLNGAAVIALDKGVVAPEERREGVIPKLETALRAQSHASIALRLEAIVPYETAALILNTAKQAGVQNAAFQVREVGINTSTKTGWLNAESYVMSSKADDVPPIQIVNAKNWDAFTSQWKNVTAACKQAASGNCAYADTNFAKGGALKIELHTSGRGLNIDFFRRGLTPKQEHEEEVNRAKELAKKKEQFLQGHLNHDEMVEFLLLGDPSTQALFQFRYQEALSAPSALTATIAPVCQRERCPVVVAADPISPMVRVMSLLGAAFPDGTQAPAYAFEMPWTKRPVPEGLPEWAMKELEKASKVDDKFNDRFNNDKLGRK